MSSNAVLIVCEKYYLRFYRPLADRLSDAGFRPIWVMLDGVDRWDYDSIDPTPASLRLAETDELTCREHADALCVFERAVFEQPRLFGRSYPYTMNVVRTLERARRLAEAWYHLTLGLLSRFRPRAVLLWNGRYLPYSAVSAACDAAGQLFLTSEIGPIPGTLLVDRGVLSTNTTDLFNRTFDSVAAADLDRADSFLKDYTAARATMVSQAVVPASELRERLLRGGGTFLLLYGCQVDWDTNVVIGARRFRSNEAAIGFLMESVSGVPGARVVVKTHPLDSNKSEDRFQNIVANQGTVVSGIHPHLLIEAADCVAVRNSTLGFEALCYRKPLIALEQAKYTHPGLTLDAPSVEHTASHLSSVSTKNCLLPDPDVLRQYVVHLLDHYLFPVRYDYFFEATKLNLLSHFAHSESYRGLEQVLTRADAPALSDQDDSVARALDACELRHPDARSSLRQRGRKLRDWLF